MRWALIIVVAGCGSGCQALIGDVVPSGLDAGHAGEADAAVDGGAPADAGVLADAGSLVDAGTSVDAGRFYGTDRAQFFGAPRCSRDVVLCDDFESRDAGDFPDPLTWSRNATAGITIAIDTTRAARGTKSVRFTTPNVPSEAYIRETKSFAVTHNAFYGRLFYYQQAPGPQKFAHWNVIEATGPQVVDGVQMTSFYRYGGVSLGGIFNNYLFQFEHRPREPNYVEIGQAEDKQLEPLGQWVCLEWFFDGDATEGRLWKDGVELPALHATSPFNGVSFTMPVFNGLNIGWAHYQNPEAGFEVWVDEVAVDTQRIGCNN